MTAHDAYLKWNGRLVALAVESEVVEQKQQLEKLANTHARLPAGTCACACVCVCAVGECACVFALLF